MKDKKSAVRWLLLSLFLLVMAVIQFIPGESTPGAPESPSSPASPMDARSDHNTGDATP
ncbi:hypothetical protein [Congregibacter litoralis]|uniref:hypothetical protein n=1 Tax=Congregibacter litoralis TaxID=393662 RepID=UPI0002F2A43C|nr:hypothetical protein [Congregibacter litoralis]